MTVNGISGANTQTAQMGMNQAMDSYSKNIQNQIVNAQKQLQELSSNEEMTLEEKMKKRQEIQQQISDLNMQLRQHQMEQRREKQQAKGSSMDEMPDGTNAKTGSKSAGLSQASMTAMISADTSLKQAKVQGSVATKMEGRAGVLKSEIKLDEAHGGDATKKKEELADVEQTAMQATASQMNTLAEASKAMEEAAKAERTEQKASDSKEENTAQADSKEENAAQAEGKTAGSAKGEEVQDGVSAGAQAADYTHVDVRL